MYSRSANLLCDKISSCLASFLSLSLFLNSSSRSPTFFPRISFSRLISLLCCFDNLHSDSNAKILLLELWTSCFRSLSDWADLTSKLSKSRDLELDCCKSFSKAYFPFSKSATKSSNREISSLNRLSSSQESFISFSISSFLDLLSSYSDRISASSLSTAVFTALSSSIWESITRFSFLSCSMILWFSCSSFCALNPSSDSLVSFLTVSSKLDLSLSFSRCKLFIRFSCSKFFCTAMLNSRSISSRESRSSWRSFSVFSSLLSYSINLTLKSSCAPCRLSQETFIVIPSCRSVSNSVTNSAILSFNSSMVFSFFARAFFSDSATPCCSFNWLRFLIFSSFRSTFLSLESLSCSFKLVLCVSSTLIFDSICISLLRTVKRSSSKDSFFPRRLEISSSCSAAFFSKTAICCLRSNCSLCAVSSWIE